MKRTTILTLLLFTPLMFISSGCKKKQTKPTCGCGTSEIKYSLLNINGTLSYYQYTNKWVFSYHPIAGNSSNYFPCNTTQESLQAILQGANHNQVFQVKFSGKVKESCFGEDFGYTSGVTTFDYIIIDSIKLN